MWDTENPRAVASISREVHYPHFVEFLPDGQTLMSVDSAGTTCWNVAEKRRQRSIARPNTEIRSVYISPTGSIRAIGSIENRLLVWDVDADETIATFAGHQEFVRTFAFAPAGEPFASGDTEGGLYVWDPQGKQTALLGHTRLIRSLAFDRDGKRLVSGSTDGTARVWDVVSGEEIATLPLAPFDLTLESENYIGDAEQKQRKLRLQHEQAHQRRHNLRILSHWRQLFFHRVEVSLLVECTTRFGCGMPQIMSFSWRYFHHMNVGSRLR